MITNLAHLTVNTEGSLPGFPTEEDRLAVVRRFVEYADGAALWFSAADTHFHSVLEVEPARRGIVARDVRFLLSPLVRTPILAPHLKPIEGRGHLENTFPYVHGNRERHGLPGNPFADPGCSIADLVGARRLPGFDATRWKRYLPRLDLRVLLARVGLFEPVPATDEAVRSAGAAVLVGAAAAMIGVPVLAGKSRDVVAARVAVVRVGLAAGIPRSELAWALGVRRQGIPERMHRSAPELEDMLRLRLGFDVVLAKRVAKTA
jgi:hypothetical protein